MSAEVEHAQAAVAAAQELAIRAGGDDEIVAIAAGRLQDVQAATDAHAAQYPDAAREYSDRLEADRLRRLDIPAAETRLRKAEARLRAAHDPDARAARQTAKENLRRRFDAQCELADRYARSAASATRAQVISKFRGMEQAARLRAERLRQRLENIDTFQTRMPLLQAEVDTERQALLQLTDYLKRIEIPTVALMPLKETRNLSTDDIPQGLQRTLRQRYTVTQGKLHKDGREVKAATVQVEGVRLSVNKVMQLF